MSRSTRRRRSGPTTFSFSSYAAFASAQIVSVISSVLFSSSAWPLELGRIDAEHARDLTDESGNVPLGRVYLLARKAVDLVLEDLFAKREHVLARVDDFVLGQMDSPLEDLASQRVDALTLLVHHVVVLEEMLADGEVLRLDLALCALNSAGHHAVLDGYAFLHPEALHQT